MLQKLKRAKIAAAALLLSLLMVSTTLFAADELWVGYENDWTNWTGGNYVWAAWEKCPGASDFPAFKVAGDALYSALCSSGPYSDYCYKSTTLKNYQYLDSTYYDEYYVGQDQTYIDRADVGALFTHGGLSPTFESWGGVATMYNSWYQNYSSPDYGCTMYQHDMVYGDKNVADKGDMEHLIVGGCHGAHRCIVYKWKFNEELHAVHGYHGGMTGSPAGTWTNFVSDAWDDSIAIAWSDNLETNYDCPTSVGPTYKVTNGIFTYYSSAYITAETLSLGYPDNSSSNLGFLYVMRNSNCNPMGSWGSGSNPENQTWESTVCDDVF